MLRHVRGDRVVALRDAVARLPKAHGHRRIVVVRDRHHDLRRRRGRDPGGQGPERQPHPLPVVVDRVLLSPEVERLRRVPAHERQPRRHSRIVGARCTVHVGHGDRDFHRPLRIGAQQYRHRDVVAFRHCVGRIPKAHGDGGIVVVRDGHRGRRVRPRAHPVRQAGQRQLHRLAVVVGVVRLRGEGEGLLRVAAQEGHPGRHAGVVRARRSTLVHLEQRDLAVPLRIRAESHGHCHLVLRHAQGQRIVALGHRVRCRAEAHRHRRVVVICDRNRRRRRGAGAHARGQVAEGQLHGLPVVIEGVGLRRERERLCRVPTRERHAGGHAFIVPVAGPALVRPRNRYFNRPLRVRAQRHRDRDLVLRHVRGRGVVTLRHGVAGLPEAHRHSRVVVVRDRHRRRGGCPGSHGVGQVAEAQPHRFAVVIQRVGGRREGEGLIRVAALEGHAGGHAGVVAARGAALIHSEQRDHHLPLRVLAERYRHRDVVLRHVRGARIVALRHAVAGLPETHRHRDVFVVDHRHVHVGHADPAVVAVR